MFLPRPAARCEPLPADLNEIVIVNPDAMQFYRLCRNATVGALLVVRAVSRAESVVSNKEEPGEMKLQNIYINRAPVGFAKAVLGGGLLIASQITSASGSGWSIVPYLGFSQLGDQAPSFAADGIAGGEADISIDSGFTGGVSIRYDYADSRWTSELGWEYRSNDATITSSDGSQLPGGNYASNTFLLTGRYALSEGSRFTPWIGGGLSVVQEIDLDSEGADSERSFSASGSIGFQVMAGVDYDITDRVYLSGELRYTSFTDLDLNEEGGDGQVSGLDYQPVTIGLGLGIRF